MDTDTLLSRNGLPLPTVSVEGMRSYQLRKLAQFDPWHRAVILRYGAGKTWMVIAHTSRVHAFLNAQSPSPSQAPRIQAFVFCKTNNVLTWENELILRAPNTPFYSGTEGLDRLADALANGEFIPSNAYVLLPHHRMAPRLGVLRHLLHELRPSALICDESTAIKRIQPQSTKAALLLSHEQHKANRLCVIMSGKPDPEGPHELWSQYQFAYGNANPLGDTYYKFLQRWFVRSGGSKPALRHDRIAEFYATVNAHSLYLTPEDIKEWQEQHSKEYAVVKTVEYFEPSEEQRRLLAYLYDNWALPEVPPDGSIMGALGALDEEDDFDPFRAASQYAKQEVETGADQDTPTTQSEEYQHVMTIAGKAQQIASGFYYTKQGPVYLESNPKRDALGELLETLFSENPGRQIIIWQRFSAELPIITNLLESLQISYVIGPDRATMQLFIDADRHVRPSVIIMPTGVTEGFNELSNADVAIWYSNSYSQEKRDQAVHRNTEMRQKHPVVVIIDLAGYGLQDTEVVMALQAKTFTPGKLMNISNTYLKPKK